MTSINRSQALRGITVFISGHEWETPCKEETNINLVTWVFEEGGFVPCAKITEDNSYSIVTDYLGTPTQMFDSDGENTWSAELDIYGRVRTFKGSSLKECPFRYQGQYEDEETGLYYNRFRYYDPGMGNYISQDPIGLEGNNPTLYGYVKDPNIWLDVWGLITVYRFDTRTPSEIRSGGGFSAKVPNANVDLLDYATHNNPSQYISTSYSVDSAVQFGNDYYGGNGYVYKIEIDDSKGIDVNKALGLDSPFPNEKEFAVINNISNDEIKGSADMESITDTDNIKWSCS